MGNNLPPTITTCKSLGILPPESWKPLEDPNNPFTHYAFLRLLEATGCIGADTGWHPQHLLAHDGTALIAALPSYSKDHSMGEFVFDQLWAQASYRAGLPYYPKLIAAVPFTPATTPKVLKAPSLSSSDSTSITNDLVAAFAESAKCGGLSSSHALFLGESELPAWLAHSYLLRLGTQFHWENNSYRDITDFWETFRSKARKNAARERRAVNEAGVEIFPLTGTELTLEALDFAYRCYLETFAKHLHTPSLSRAFFLGLKDTFADRTLLFIARRGRKNIASALCFFAGSNLYGRYWGAIEDVPCLHFELCYHAPIAYAIQQGFQKYEAGAQGEHKLARGLLPAKTYSAHLLNHPLLHSAVENYLTQEIRYIDEEREHYEAVSPQKRG